NRECLVIARRAGNPVDAADANERGIPRASSVSSFSRSPANGHANRRILRDEQADSVALTGVCPCIFLIKQAKCRESAGTAPRGPRIKKPIAGRPGIGAQFQLWIFSYTIFARLTKNKLSRLMIACAALRDCHAW